MSRWPGYLKNKYNHLLLVLLLVLLFYPFLRVEKNLVPLLFLIAVIPALVSVLRRMVLAGFIGASLLIYGLFLSSHQPQVVLITYSVYTILLAMVIFLLCKDILGTMEITTDTLRGGLSIYLLLGFLWAELYILCEQFLPGAFSRPDPAILYFSFTTLTTLGYGDITPTHEIIQILTTLEALVGQIYLTVFIARLVGLQLIKRGLD